MTGWIFRDVNQCERRKRFDRSDYTSQGLLSLFLCLEDECQEVPQAAHIL